MPFTVITLGEFLDNLADRLDDPNSSFFTRDELLEYTTETLRTWAAHTGYWVRRAEFLTTPGVKDYDLTNLAKYNPGTGNIYPVQLTVTDRELVNSLAYSLLEPPITVWSSGWIGTEQFSLSLLLDAAKFAVNAMQSRDGLIGQATSQIAYPTPINQYTLANDYLNIRSAYWQVVEGQQYPLARQNQHVRSLIPDYSPTPNSFSVVATAPRRVELSPNPTDTGTLVYIYNPGHNTLIPTSAATTLYIPTNFAWAAKYYALFTLLSAEGERRDKFRADYCAMRIKDSRTLANILPGVLRCFIDGVETGSTAAWDEDFNLPNWRNLTGKPDHLVNHAWNIISLSAIPATTTDNPTGEFSISFDLAANAPIPSNEADYLDIGSELIQPLVDYAHHLACFKLGGQEFSDSIPSYERFLKMAMQYNSKLLAESQNFELLREKSNTQKRRRPIATETGEQE